MSDSRLLKPGLSYRFFLLPESLIAESMLAAMDYAAGFCLTGTE
jgi:hypothetical protein